MSMMSFLAFMDACFATFSKILIPIIVADRMSIVVPAYERYIMSWLGLAWSREV